MDCRRIAAQIDRLKYEVQCHRSSYLSDGDVASVIDAQLNGHIKAIQTYCKLNNLTSFADSVNAFFPVDRTAIEFFSLWDNIKADMIEHSESLQGRERQRIISKIACELQAAMTRDQIDAYLGGFSVPVSDENYTVNSKRVYVENTLKDVDGITLMDIAKDLQLLFADVVETELTEKLSSEFALQQIAKCKQKMNASDYDGAITNARTLIEEILLSIEERLEGTRRAYDRNLTALYKRVSKQINLYPDDSKTDNSFNEILRGFISIINGFAGISNNIADRHATAKHPRRHHAKLAVNSAMIIADFLLDSLEYQQNKAKGRT